MDRAGDGMRIVGGGGGDGGSLAQSLCDFERRLSYLVCEVIVYARGMCVVVAVHTPCLLIRSLTPQQPLSQQPSRKTFALAC